jgi:hypothetical protein
MSALLGKTEVAMVVMSHVLNLLVRYMHDTLSDISYDMSIDIIEDPICS